MHYIGKIDKDKIGEFGNQIVTENVILTDERKAHIYEKHSNDFELIINNLDKVVLNPSEVIEDVKSKNTIFMIDKIEKNNLNVIIKLNTTNSVKHPQNSVMTAWLIRDKN